MDASQASGAGRSSAHERGIALCEHGRFEEAVEAFEAAHAERPDSHEPLYRLGSALFLAGAAERAVASFERALRLVSDDPDTHRDLAYALLSLGDYDRGWREHEWRLRCRHYVGCGPERKFWSGGELRGRRILVHCEQGFGDTIQFLRFIPRLKAIGGQVVVRCPTRLLRLVASCPGVDLAVDGSSCEPRYDLDVPLMSLPAIFWTTLETLPAKVPYLAVDRALAEHWGNLLAAAIAESGEPDRPLRVGIAWQGNPALPVDRWRSVPLSQFGALAHRPGVRLVNLQVDHGLEQAAALARDLRLIDLKGRRGRDFMETAAIMSHLDLVITVDSVIAHLAGALGKKVWVARAAFNEWRWLEGRDDSPWYPTMRLFRQRELGVWTDVFNRIARALDAEIRDRRAA
jgi:tetratricopeptide (TPR) repeat protein